MLVVFYSQIKQVFSHKNTYTTHAACACCVEWALTLYMCRKGPKIESYYLVPSPAMPSLSFYTLINSFRLQYLSALLTKLHGS